MADLASLIQQLNYYKYGGGDRQNEIGGLIGAIGESLGKAGEGFSLAAKPKLDELKSQREVAAKLNEEALKHLKDPLTGEQYNEMLKTGKFPTGIQIGNAKVADEGTTVYDPATKTFVRRTDIPKGTVFAIPSEKPAPKLDPNDPEVIANKLAAKNKATLLANKPQTETTLRTLNSNLDLLKKNAQSIMDDPNISDALGMTGKIIGNIPGTPQKGVRERINSLIAKAATNALQSLRNSSKTGGALGNTSDNDIVLLKNSIAALDTSQGSNDFKRSLQDVIDYADGAKSNANQGYESSYGEPFGVNKEKTIVIPKQDTADVTKKTGTKDKSTATIKVDAQGNRAYVWPDGTFEEIK